MSAEIDAITSTLALDTIRKLEAENDRLREALEKIRTECSTFPIKNELAFRCESIALNGLAKEAGQ